MISVFSVYFLPLSQPKKGSHKQTNKPDELAFQNDCIAWLLEAGLKQTYNENGQVDKNKCGDILFTF